ncbi:MAG: 4-hydroxy-3-methylbut-2-enyl diphosphate reductase [Prevotellaceae bacterium]|jgi:4-hydroxy-3-methylbut-2-enyl diphosphate reductase|nr:4-hydroxy-3-methylbut-2-enyl diphosphate reductase [Prevotellaceae bacterium]
MIVEIDEKSGFCYGVIRAIETTENELEHSKYLFSLGEIVHNDIEVDRLEKIGLHTIDHNKIADISGQKMIIRAHGEPPSTYQIAKENNIEVIDCTCPVVLKLQERIKQSYEGIKAINGQLIIFGKRGHAEVNGLIGQVDGDAIVIEKLDEIEQINFERPVYLFAQTTKSMEEFEILRHTILRRMRQALGTERVPFESHNSICRQVANRKPHLEDFSRKHDVIIFVSGRQSSNGKILFHACKSVNERTYFVEHPEELKSEWFVNCCSVGVCGATSTPKWLMEDVANEVKRMNS